MSYPDEFLRGISNNANFDDNGLPMNGLFKFEANTERHHNCEEVSINWHDDSGAIEEILSKTTVKKEAEVLQFPKGVAVMCTHSLKSLTIMPLISDYISYERFKIKGNDYHGNILLSDTTPKHIKKTISAALHACYKSTIK